MFGLGMGELIVIFIVALIVLGPARLPKLAQDLGKAIREFRKAADDMKQELQADDDLKRPFQELKEAVTLTPEEIRAREDAKKALSAQAEEQAHAEAQAVAAQAAAQQVDPNKKPQ
jgi:sec-independent protein translocase protein TatB